MSVKHDPDSHRTQTNAPAAVVEVGINNAYSGSDCTSLESCFRNVQGVTDVHLDRTRGVVHLSYDPGLTTPETVEDQLSRRGLQCDCIPRQDRNRIAVTQVSVRPTVLRWIIFVLPKLAGRSRPS